MFGLPISPPPLSPSTFIRVTVPFSSRVHRLRQVHDAGCLATEKSDRISLDLVDTTNREEHSALSSPSYGGQREWFPRHNTQGATDCLIGPAASVATSWRKLIVTFLWRAKCWWLNSQACRITKQTNGSYHIRGYMSLTKSDSDASMVFQVPNCFHLSISLASQTPLPDHILC